METTKQSRSGGSSRTTCSLSTSGYTCDECHDTGYFGDMGPGRAGNNEYVPCDCRRDKRTDDEKWRDHFVLPIAMEMQRRGIGEMRIKLTEKGTAVFELLNALKNSLDPCFAHLEETLLEGDGKVLDIRITVKAGKIKLEYGVGDLVPLTRCSIFSSFNA